MTIVWKYREKYTEKNGAYESDKLESSKYGVLESTASPEMRVFNNLFPEDERLEITGARGYMWVTEHHGRLFRTAPLIVFSEGRVTYFDDVDPEFNSGFTGSVNQFVDAMLDDRQPILAGDQGKRMLEIIFAAYQSARTGKAVLAG
jgi:predicted dehydrogenase